MFHDNNDSKWYSPKAEEWYYRLMNDPEYIEREYYSDRNKWYDDRIDVWSSMIEEFELLYERVPPTQYQQHNRDRVQGGIKQLQRELANIQSEYDQFKEAQDALR